MSVGAMMFKDSSLLGKFALPPPPLNQNVSPINMISSTTHGSLGSSDTWVVTHPLEVEYYGDHMPLKTIDLACLSIQLTSSKNESNHQ